jgi:hypothetical protein
METRGLSDHKLEHEAFFTHSGGVRAYVSLRRAKIREEWVLSGFTLELSWDGVLPGKPIHWREAWQGSPDEVATWIESSASRCPAPEELNAALEKLIKKLPSGLL